MKFKDEIIKCIPWIYKNDIDVMTKNENDIDADICVEQIIH